MLLPLVGGLGLVGNLASVVVLRLELATNLREVSPSQRRPLLEPSPNCTFTFYNPRLYAKQLLKSNKGRIVWLVKNLTAAQSVLIKFLNVKTLVGTFNQEKALA